jgi:hypothetical protein
MSSLPKIKHPLFPYTMFSTGKKIQFRPYTAKEEKIFILAETEEDENIIDVLQQIVNNCVVTKGFKAEEIPLFELELLFLKIRAKSVNNIIEFSLTDKEDKNKYDISLDLDSIGFIVPEGHTNKITIEDNIGIVMRYPNAKMMKNIIKKLEEDKDKNVIFNVLSSSIETIYDGDKVFAAGTDFDEAAAAEWLDELPYAAFAKVVQFFTTMPRVEHTITYKKKDGKDGKEVLSGLRDFFTF